MKNPFHVNVFTYVFLFMNFTSAALDMYILYVVKMGRV